MIRCGSADRCEEKSTWSGFYFKGKKKYHCRQYMAGRRRSADACSEELPEYDPKVLVIFVPHEPTEEAWMLLEKQLSAREKSIRFSLLMIIPERIIICRQHRQYWWRYISMLISHMSEAVSDRVYIMCWNCGLRDSRCLRTAPHKIPGSTGTSPPARRISRQRSIRML